MPPLRLRDLVLPTVVVVLEALGWQAGLLAAESAPVASVAVPADAAALAGVWLGPLKVGPVELRLALKIAVSDDGMLTAKLDSIDQGAKDIPVDAIAFENGTLTAELKTINGKFIGTLDKAGDALEGTWTQGLASLPLVLKKTGGDVALRRPQEPKPPFPYWAEEVTFPGGADGVALAGTLTLPEGSGPFPAVILISGSGPQGRDESLMGHRPFAVLADHLSRKGIAVLRYDDRGVADSTGKFATATSEDFKHDAAAALSYLKTHDEIDSQRIGLCGHSEGGLVAPMVAVQSPEVAFIVLMAGTGVTGEEILYRQSDLIARSMGADDAAVERAVAMQRKIFTQLKSDPNGNRLVESLKALVAELPTESERKAAEQQLKAQAGMIGSPWFRAFLVLDPRESLAKVTCPVLAINGEKDLQVDPKQNLAAIEAALKAGGNRDVTVVEFPGLNHLFQTCKTGAVSEYGQIEETISPAALEAISDWIVARTSDARRH